MLKISQIETHIGQSIMTNNVGISHLADGSHLHDILELLIHVPECEFPVLDSVVEFLVVTNIKVFNNFHQTFDVTHAKQLLHKRNCVEGLKLEQTRSIL